MMLELPEVIVDAGLPGRAEQHELRTVLQTVEHGVLDQMHAFLRIEPADVGDERLEVPAHPQAVAQCFLVRVLVVDIPDIVVRRNEPVDFRIPDVVIDAVEHAAELVAVHGKRMSESVALIGMLGLPGMVW